MASNQPTMSKDLCVLKEKLNLKRLDLGGCVHENEAVLAHAKAERHALLIGNVCLRHMTNKQMMRPITMNAKVFANHPPREKLRMQKMKLQDSIVVNDSRLFKLGKRLLKQDHVQKRQEECLAKSKWDLDQAKMEARNSRKDYDDKHEKFQHKQVMVQDSRNRELSAKLIYHRLQKILDELNKDLLSFPVRIKQLEKTIAEKKAEFQDFTGLRDRAKRYLAVEEEALKPVNQELESVTKHFDALILSTRNELDDRRKSGALAKFLAEREANSLNFCETANIMEIQFKKRNRAINAYEIITSLMDATMVSDIENVVDCFLDQTDVSRFLTMEKEHHQHTNSLLRAQLRGLQENNKFLKYDDNRSLRYTLLFHRVVAEESKEIKEIDQLDYILRKEEKIIANIQLAVYSMSEKLRPIKLEDPWHQANGDLRHDIQLVIKKMEKMGSIIATNSTPIGPVRPIMLHMFKEQRLPPDSTRVDTTVAGINPSMTSFEKFESDSPGLVTREMLKARAAESRAKEEKKKRGKQKPAKK